MLFVGRKLKKALYFMKCFLSIFCLLLSSYSFSQLTDSTIYDLKTGRLIEDTSFIYSLPYEIGKKYLFVQGANSKFSHKNELSYDFKMSNGSKICAARDGVVIATKSDSDKGGVKDEFLDDGNHVIIRHSDGSIAHYWHLEHNGVLVNVGDIITKGQVIGLSGNTGYTAFPHLHFQVLSSDGKQILVRFQTKKGVIYIRPGRHYKSVS
jgi:murein DD-endopeptidase MepM/ murein hydrolase activator NlpD